MLEIYKNMNKPLKFTKHIEKVSNVPIGHKNLKYTWLFFKFSVIFFWISLAIYGVYSFFNTYTLRTPIIIQSPIVPRKIEVNISPVGSDSAKLKTLDIGEIADKIYTLESSQGKNDGCRKLGLYNGYGFSQSAFSWKCFSSHEEVRQLVIDWLIDNISKYGLEQALCRYNIGEITNDCKYVVDYKNL